MAAVHRRLLCTTVKLKESPNYDERQLIKTFKSLFAWGCCEHGALGIKKSSGHKLKRYISKPVSHIFSQLNSIKDAECGFGFTVISVHSKTKYKLFGSGINTDSQIGYHDPRKDNPLSLLLTPAPVELGLLEDTQISSMSAGRAHTAVVTDEGVLTLGSNCYGQCGRRIIENEKYTGSRYIHKIPLLDGQKILNVSCGQDHTIFITENGRVYGCGWGADGQTAQGNCENVSYPAVIQGDLKNEKIVKVSCRSDTILSLSEKGEVFGWGNNEYGQLSSSLEHQFISTPIILSNLKTCGKIVDVAAGGSFCMALNENGEVFVWGYGILGLGPNVQSSKVPQLIPRTLFGGWGSREGTVKSIACGLSHLAAITNDGNLYCWGKNREGALGIGQSRDQNFPYKVAIGQIVEKVSCGLDHTVAICKPYSTS